MNQMDEAMSRMAEHHADSMRVNRRGWTQEQWCEDAERLMNDVDGSVSSLVNGHVLALLRYRSELLAELDAYWERYSGRFAGDEYEDFQKLRRR